MVVVVMMMMTMTTDQSYITLGSVDGDEVVSTMRETASLCGSSAGSRLRP
jgi:hypothetical protein